MSTSIPYERINKAALSCLENLLASRFPAGKRCGREYKVGSLKGEAGESLSINLDNGKWNDFANLGKGGSDPISLFAAADHKGSQSAAARALGEELGVYNNGSNKPAEAPTPKPSSFTPQTPPAGCVPTAAEIGRHDGIWPYRNAAGQPTHYVRRVNRPTPAGQKQKKDFYSLTYGVLKGKLGWHNRAPNSPRPLYGLDRLAARPTAPIIVCEGEKAADAAALLFPDRVCVSWMGGSASVGKADWTPMLGRPSVAIWPDNDAVGHEAAAELQGHLPQAKVLDISDMPEGTDAADLRHADPATWLRNRLPPEGHRPTETPLPLLWLDDIEPVLQAQDFVQGVLMQGGAAVVYGESNSGKTFWATDLALHVAQGKRWNDRRVDQSGVVYCVMEGGNGFRNRVSAWRRGNMTEPGLPFAAIPSTINLLDPEADTPRLIETVNAAAGRISHPVRLIVVDTLSRAMAGGNENAPDDMGALVANMDRIRTETGACVMFIHHCGKDAARDARGHSSLRAAIDTEIEVIATDDARSATVVKQRDLAKGAVFAFRLETLTLGQNQHGEDVTTCTVEAAEAVPPPRKDQPTTSERAWLRELTDMFAQPGAAELRKPFMSGFEELTLTRKAVRQGFRDRGRFSCEPDANLTSADRERLRSVLNRLKDKGKIGMTADLIWLVTPRQVASDLRQC